MGETKSEKIIICILVLIAIVGVTIATVKVCKNSIEYMNENKFDILDNY